MLVICGDTSCHTIMGRVRVRAGARVRVGAGACGCTRAGGRVRSFVRVGAWVLRVAALALTPGTTHACLASSQLCEFQSFVQVLVHQKTNFPALWKLCLWGVMSCLRRRARPKDECTRMSVLEKVFFLDFGCILCVFSSAVKKVFGANCIAYVHPTLLGDLRNFAFVGQALALGGVGVDVDGFCCDADHRSFTPKSATPKHCSGQNGAHTAGGSEETRDKVAAHKPLSAPKKGSFLHYFFTMECFECGETACMAQPMACSRWKHSQNTHTF